MEDSGNLADLEAKIATLERSEFQLKMQVFYLHKKLSEGAQNAAEEIEDQSMMSVSVMEDRSVDIIALREDLEYSRRKVVDLESEVLQLQLLRDNEALEYQKLIQMQPSTDVALLEESRRREREVAKTIAEHDGALIAQLQSDLATLQTQHESDVALVEDCTSRLSAEMERAELKDAELAELRIRVSDLTKKVGILTDTARQQEQLLSEAAVAQDTHINADALAVELETIKVENSSLKDQLERQKATTAIQAEALTQLRTVASEMGKFENDELTRLGTELSQCHDEKESAQLACQRLEHDNAVLQKQLNDLKGLKSMLPGAESVFTSSVDGSSTSKTLGGSDSAFTPAAVLIQETTSNIAAVSEVPTVDPRILENYRNREADLLAALEGLIVRCQELELQAHLRDEQHAQLQNQVLLQAQQLQQLQAAMPQRTLLDNSPRKTRPSGLLSNSLNNSLSNSQGNNQGTSTNNQQTPGRTRSAGPESRAAGKYDRDAAALSVSRSGSRGKARERVRPAVPVVHIRAFH